VTSRAPLDGLYAGLDVSTQSCKLVVIDVGAGETVHLDAVRYDDDLPAYETSEGTVRGLGEGVRESDPRMWIEAVDLLLGRLASAGVDPAALRCVSVSGQMHGLVALDGDGDLARPRAKLWNDFSTLEECRLLTERVGGVDAMIREVGNTQRAGYTAPKILHMLRHEPEAYRRTATFLVVHNFINWYLTGGKDGGVAVLEPGDASGTALWSPVTGAWSKVVIDALDAGLAGKLPPVWPATATIGAVGADLVARFGLSPECRVDAGSGDNMYGALGTGNYAPGVVTVSLGTSGTAAAFTDEPFVDPTGAIASYCDSTGHWLPLLCVSNLANGYKAVRETFGLGHREFDDLVAASPPGNGGRLLVPWYEGERTPDVPLASPIQLGFGVDDFVPEVLCRAVLEGHVLNLQAGFGGLPVEPDVIHLTGGLSVSAAWCRAIADIFEVEVVPVLGEGAALGAAIHAAWVWLRESGRDVSMAEVAGPFVVLDEARRTKPDAGCVAAHRVQKRLFRALTRRVRGLEGEDPFEVRAELLRSEP
jgi:xylulokinase